MTQAEFNAAIKNAMADYRDMIGKINIAISEIYKTAANQIAEQIKNLEVTGKGDSLTAVSMRKLESSLRSAGAYVAGETEKIIIDGINDVANIAGQPHLDYLQDAIELSKTEKIDFSTIQDIYSVLNTNLIELTYSRLWQDGYTFSERIWSELPTDFQAVIKNLITLGLAQGRDILDIAKDITDYASHGKEKLMKRYGELIRGTAEFYKRIPKWIDWRAMRIARSELYISLQEAAKQAGHNNPAVRGYKWNMTSGGGEHNCVCPDLEANSPYLETEIPDYPHSNCLCYLTFIIMARDDFINDLIALGDGISIPYLDTWYHDVYLPEENG